MSDDETNHYSNNRLGAATKKKVAKKNDETNHYSNNRQGAAIKKKAAKKKVAAKKSTNQVAILFVKCKKDHFHRAGIRWVKNGFGVLVSDLTDEQIDAIMSEPMLVAEEGSINDNALDGIVRVNQD